MKKQSNITLLFLLFSFMFLSHSTNISGQDSLPSAKITAPTDSLFVGPLIVVSGTASASSKILEVKVNGILATSSGQNYDTWFAWVNLPTGMQKIIVTIADELGNSNPSADSITVTVQNINRQVIIPDDDATISMYSPFIIYIPNSHIYRMYFGRNMGDWAGYGIGDQIFMSENDGDGLTQSGWKKSILVLKPSGSGSSTYDGGDTGLIHDPTVIYAWNRWNMYYTGTYEITGAFGNRIFYATSSDGINWIKQGWVRGINQEKVIISSDWGLYHPYILDDHGKYRLYYFSEIDNVLHCATTVDGLNFQDDKKVTNFRAYNPDVRVVGNEYMLTYDNPDYANIYQTISNTSFWFSRGKKVLSPSTSGWDNWHIGTSCYLPHQGLLYYFGNRYNQSHWLNDGSIGIQTIEIDLTDVDVEATKQLPKDFFLYQNYPNPFNPETFIVFSLPITQHVLLKIYDLLGRELSTLVNEEKQSGTYEVIFDGTELSSGVYFYLFKAGEFIQTKKFVLMK